MRPIAATLLFLFLMPSAGPAQREVSGGRVASWLKADGDGDGKLSEAETSGLMARYFEANDADRDGFLDRAELVALDRRLASRQRVRRGQEGGGRPAAEVPDGVIFKEDIAYREGHALWKLDLAYPGGEVAEGGRPGLVIVHGGGWKGGDKGGGQWRRLPLEYAAKGYVAISVNYRLCPEVAHPAHVEDVKCAVRWLRAHAEEYGLDPDRVGAYGNSAGAHLVSMLGLVGKEAGMEGDGPDGDRPSLVQAVCASATPARFAGWMDGAGPRGLLAGDAAGLAARAEAASPVTYAHAGAPPFLLVHARDDRTVPFAQGEALEKALVEAGAAHVTLMAYDDGGHGVFGAKAGETGPAMAAFFAEHLGL